MTAANLTPVRAELDVNGRRLSTTPGTDTSRIWPPCSGS